MRITIFRPNQIGGQSTRIETSTSAIVIDLGQNLKGNGCVSDWASDDIANITANAQAVLYTHYHGDHIGWFHSVEDVPQYVGEVAKRVLVAKYSYLSQHNIEGASEALRVCESMKTLRMGCTVTFGDIKVTPLLVSHSAYEAFMFLIEADGCTILHTGDFRGHGFLSKRTFDVIEKYVKRCDILITEGTMLGRKDEKIERENELKEDAKALIRRYKYVFVHCSSTDLERLSAFKAANQEVSKRRMLVCDYYQQQILNVFTETAGLHSPLFRFDGSKPFAPSYRPMLTEMIENGFLMLVRPGSTHSRYMDIILPNLAAADTLLIYSMWSGYIEPGNPSYDQHYADFHRRFANIARLHTSGHASVKVLSDLCEKVNPTTAILPIHKDAQSSFENIVPLSEELRQKVVTQNFSSDKIDIRFV